MMNEQDLCDLATLLAKEVQKECAQAASTAILGVVSHAVREVQAVDLNPIIVRIVSEFAAARITN